MGQEITYSHFDAGDIDRYYQKLEQETNLLGKLIEQKAFSKRSPIAGFEVEAWLLDKNMRPVPDNENYLASLNDPMASAELAKFNIELNNLPLPLCDNVFSELHNKLNNTWENARRHAEHREIHLLMIGTLPTLKQSDLSLDNMSNLNRYRALNEQILHSRGKPIHLDITGHEHLKFDHNDVMLESATTSFQIHTQLPLQTAHHYYNASIIASAPVVAVCANAPYLFGKDLWHESRIPLFEQAIETGGYDGAAQGPLRRVSFGSDYARKSIVECFNENLEHFPILLPEQFDSDISSFEHLRLHNGTIWRWNRPLLGFDDDGTPHIRVEHRTPAAGPGIVDMIANSAFYFGLSKNLCDEMVKKGIRLPFAQAKDNFYQAARYGLDTTIIWFNGEKQRLQDLLKSELLARARAGLKSLGVNHCEIDEYLDIIRQRVESKQCGSHWQRQFMQKHQSDFETLTKQYLQNQRIGNPVSEWKI
jgi:gamma-glutamyl:cysteine ligase YbdK (ATP-grasp superfamily)